MTNFFDPNTKFSSMGGLAVILTYLSDEDLKPCKQISREWKKAVEKTPLLTLPHRFEAKIQHRNDPVYLRMELLTDGNTSNWKMFHQSTLNLEYKGFSSIAKNASQGSPYSSEVEECTGFTSEEYAIFQKEIGVLVTRTHGKVLSTLSGVFGGAVGFHPEINNTDTKYVVYATNNPDFIIPLGNKNLNYKQYKDLYKHILIAFVSNHGNKEYKRTSFENRGIFRPFHHILENQYEGLSMLLHGFTGIIAKKFFPTIDTMNVRPLPSMQTIIQKKLKRGEGHLSVKRKEPLAIVIPKGGFEDEWDEFEASVKSCYENKDILDYTVDQRQENPTNCIQNSALVRIYSQS